MAGSDASGEHHRFRVWVRRRGDAQGPYALRFEVAEGKGILRVARPGVLVDPPARPAGIEERLTAAQVRASRFLHVWEAGRHRQGHLFARLDETGLEALPADRWIELVSATEGTTALLKLPAEIGPDSGIIDDEPTWPRREMLVGLQRELRGVAGAVPPPEEWATEVRTAPVIDPDAYVVEPRRGVAPAERVRIGPSNPPAPASTPLPTAPVMRPPSLAADSLGDWIDTHAIDAAPDEDQTIIADASSISIVSRLDLDATPRQVAASVRSLGPESAEARYTTLDTHDSGDVLEALDAGGESDEAMEPMEAMEAFEEPGDHGVMEALEATGDHLDEALPAEGEEDDDEVVVEDEPEVTDVGRRSVDALQRARGPLTEAVTVMPLGAQELAADAATRLLEPVADAAVRVPAPAASAVAERAPALALRASEPPKNDATAPVGGPAPTASEAGTSLHERNTTLVRHLRRRITEDGARHAADRAHIARLEARVEELEAELARRSRV